MITGNAKMATWGIGHLGNLYPSEIIELGCGAGRNVPELLKTYPSSRVTAVDQSEVSVEKAKEYNKRAIESGRYIARWGDVSSLDESSEQYDLATAFETIIFWPSLKSRFAEVDDAEHIVFAFSDHSGLFECLFRRGFERIHALGDVAFRENPAAARGGGDKHDADFIAVHNVRSASGLLDQLRFR